MASLCVWVAHCVGCTRGTAASGLCDLRRNADSGIFSLRLTLIIHGSCSGDSSIT